MADLSTAVIVNLIDYPPRLDGAAGTALASVLSEVATEFVRAGTRGYDAHHDDAHTAADLEDEIVARVEAARTASTADDYRRRLVQAASVAVAAVQRWDRVHPTPSTEADHG